MPTALRAEGLGKVYRVPVTQGAYGYRTLREELGRAWSRLAGYSPSAWRSFWALRDVSFELPEGQTLGIVGRNGAGKSTLLKLLSRVTEPTAGQAEIRGRVATLLEVGSGFHPELTGRENVFLNGALLGMKRSEIRRKFDAIVAFAEVAAFIDTPVKRYSSGMYLRLAFSIAAHLEAEILLVDETLAVGDVVFQRRCIEKMRELATGGRTVLLVSHNMSVVETLCTTACHLQDGCLVDWGPPEDVVKRYLGAVAATHPTGLSQRTDRQGDGNIRLTSVLFEDKEGHQLEAGQSGQDLKIAMNYEATRDLSQERVTFGIAVNTIGGAYLFSCGTDLVESDFIGAPRVGVARCRIPRLPLTPGSYSLNLIVRRGGMIEDWILDAITLNVEAGDFFGSGQLPPPSHVGLLVDHSWSFG